MPTPRLDLVGRRFGRYVVIAEAPYRGLNRYLRCRCDCGTEKDVAFSSLRQGTSNSCGCLRRERLALENPALKHGRSTTPEYIAWKNMRRRCYDHKYTEYPRYGARGIQVCKAWQWSFESFLNDMGLRPGRWYSVERRDNNGNYEPGNCYWATATEQANNRRTNTLVTLMGRTQTLAMWCKELGVKHHTVMTRMGKRGWSVERALTTPTRKWERKLIVAPVSEETP